jgi:hypothetical protein
MVSRFVIPFDLSIPFEKFAFEFLDKAPHSVVRRVFTQGALFKHFLQDEKAIVNGVDLNRGLVDGHLIGKITIRFSDKEQGNVVAARLLKEVRIRSKSHIRAAYMRPMFLHGVFLESRMMDVNFGIVVFPGTNSNGTHPLPEEPKHKQPLAPPTVNQENTTTERVVQKGGATKLRGLIHNA